jgi:hypothetical protein
MHTRELDSLSRSDLIARAESLGVEKAGVLTRAELADEIVRRTVSDPIERRIARGLLGIARDLVARVVERGLHLPDAAARIRAVDVRPSWAPAKPPIATVTLAEIYATQGHRARALGVLDEVLEKEADHVAARELRDQIASLPADDPPMPREADDAPRREPSVSSNTSGSSDTAAFVATSSTVALSPQESNAQGPVGMLDDAPLPERYDVDEIVLMPVDPKTVFVYWELRQATVDEARQQAEKGKLIMRIVAVSASWEGPSVETRDIEIDELVGDWFVRDLPVGAVLRAAVGWRAASGFEPLSVAMELSSPQFGPAPVGAHELAQFTAEGVVPVERLRPEDESIAAALERARRRVARAAAEPRGSSSWVAIAPAPWGTFESVSSST